MLSASSTPFVSSAVVADNTNIIVQTDMLSRTKAVTVKGDVNADGVFNVDDVTDLQRWLLAVPNVELKNWKAADLCEDDRLDVFDLCILRQMYSEQIQKTDSFYSLSSEMIQDNDLKYGSSVMSDDFYSKRLIVKTKSAYDFSKFSPKSVISGFDNIYVVQFESYESAKLCVSALEKDEKIEYIELDKYMKCEELASEQVTESNSWGVSAIEADKYAEYLSDNYDSSVVVSVVDTGVSSHSFLSGRILDTGYDLVDNDPDPNDKHFHGTHVAGTIVDCTPELNIQIMPVRVLDANGSGSYLNVGNGIRYATEHGADIINLSLGGSGCSPYIDDSIEYAVDNGVTVVVAAGNENDDTKYYCPSHLENCIVVAACDSEYEKAYFSNYGNSVDVTAPGIDILSCVPGGDYESKNGTSMATPHISAAAAMIKYADENATPAEIEQKIKDISLDLGDVGKDVYYGYGLPKLSKLINNDSPDVPIVASGKCGDDVYYTLDENGLLTISGTGNMTDFVLYSNVSPWNKYHKDIKKVVIENGVTSIGDWAFYDCNDLTSITIPNSITSIGNYAFYNCSSLTSINIPDSMTYIGNGVFNNCYRLTSINVSENNSSYMNKNGVLFDKNEKTLIKYPEGKKDTEYIIPNSVTTIGNYAFYQCKQLTSITISNSVTSIGKWAFYDCNVLKSINIPDSVTSIGEFAFDSCSSSTSLTIPNSVTNVGQSAFSGCSSLTSVIIPDSFTIIAYGAFSGCSGLTSVTIPDSVTYIKDYAFQDCSHLTSINIPDSVTHIGSYAFRWCKGLTSVTIPNSVTHIENNSFGYCDKLESIIISNPDCRIFDYAETISETATIYGYAGSTAQAYAEKYNRTFVAID